MIDLTTDEQVGCRDRLDMDHVHGVGAQVRSCIGYAHAVEACYMPGDGTWYALAFVPLGGNERVVGAAGGGMNGMEPHSWFYPAAESAVMIVYGQGGSMVTILRDDNDVPNHVLEDAACALTDNRAGQVALLALLEQVFA